MNLLQKYILSILSEKIIHSPIKPRKFIEDFVSTSRKSLKSLLSVLDAFKIPNEIFDDFLKDATRHDVRRNDFDSFGGRCQSSLERLKSCENIIKFIFDKNTNLTQNAKFLSYFITDINRIEEEINGYDYKRLKDGLLSDPARIKDYIDMYKEDFNAGEVIKNWEKLILLVEEFLKEIDYRRIKLNEMLRKWSAYRAEDLTPKTEDTEILYHASADAATIYANGFSPAGPPEEGGLGGSQGDKSGKSSVSFTSDLYIAKEIYRTLKEAILIAHGEVKLKDIIAMAEEHDIDLEDTFGKSEWKKILADPNPTNVFETYRHFLHWSESINKRYNPLFFGVPEKFIKIFSTKDISDVGILACKVDMTDKSIDYLVSMSEYRVPTRAIIKIEKLIK
jgi:hypothetical protein